MIPNCNANEAASFFSSTYSTPKSRDQTNKCPSGLNVKSPSSPLVTKPISVLEIQAKIKCSRTSSAPSPLDGISYVILKKCPSILPVLMDLYNCCWTSCSIPQLWKTGIVRLIPKVGAAKTPEDPSKFRPIVLTPCIGKIYTAILKDRWCDFMIENNYSNTSIQKAFLPNVRGTDDHHFKLWSAFEDAKKSRHTLSVCWLDFANAFGSVPHWLIQDSFKLYHASDHFLRIVNNLYSNLLLSVSSDKWSTSLLPCRVGVFQGDPFSVIVFNTVINTLTAQP